MIRHRPIRISAVGCPDIWLRDAHLGFDLQPGARVKWTFQDIPGYSLTPTEQFDQLLAANNYHPQDWRDRIEPFIGEAVDWDGTAAGQLAAACLKANPVPQDRVHLEQILQRSNNPRYRPSPKELRHIVDIWIALVLEPAVRRVRGKA